MLRKSKKTCEFMVLNSVIAALLSACSTGHEEFECGPGQGLGCKTLPEVHQIINTQHVSGETPIITPVSGPQGNSQEIVLSDNSIIQRAREEHLRVWVAPFQDDQGNFHEPSVIHTVIRPSYWQMQPMNWGQS